MDSTTLITFFLCTPRTVKSVQLLGSWDNFSKPYPMEKDSRRGRGHWRGCHLFSDIICDGEIVECRNAKRDGALLEGGRYWYFYRIDDDIEIHDPKEPSTTNCPFLPGQEVNLLAIPFQAKHNQYEVPTSPSSSSNVFTLDPAARYFAPRAPTPDKLQKVHNRYRQSPQSWSRPPTAHSTSDENAPPTQQFNRCREVVELEWPTTAETSSICSEPPISVTNPIQDPYYGRPCTTGALGFGDYPSLSFDDALSVKPYTKWFWSESQEHISVPGANQAENSEIKILEDNLDEAIPTKRIDEQRKPLKTTSQNMSAASSRADWLQAEGEESATNPFTLSSMLGQVKESEIEIDSDESYQRPLSSIAEEDSEGYKGQRIQVRSNSARQSEDILTTPAGSFTCSLQHTNSVSSARTSGMFSSITSGSGANDNTKSSRLSLPLTPTISETGDVLFCAELEDEFETNVSSLRCIDSGFLGYNLPEAEYSSALTIRNLETANSRTSGKESTRAVSHRKHYVEAWNDGSEHRASNMQDLVDDLGYLGSMIA